MSISPEVTKAIVGILATALTAGGGVWAVQVRPNSDLGASGEEAWKRARVCREELWVCEEQVHDCEEMRR
jgi:hypothetical protein